MALSYMHEFHAGNFADLQKHLALTLLLKSMCKKEKPFTVIDCHASSARFDLNDERLLKTQEAKNGIEKLIHFYDNPAISLTEGLKDYLALEQSYFRKNLYAGSPEIERMFLRAGDKIHLIEKHPKAFESLQKNINLPLENPEGERKCPVKVSLHNDDSYKTLISLTPPLIKRGIIFCDPSYEDSSDYKILTQTLETVSKKWSTAVIAVWYPLLTHRKNETAQMLSTLEDISKLRKIQIETCRVEMVIKNPEDILADDDYENKSHLYGSGIFVMNPPWNFKEELEKGSKQIQKILSV